MRQHALWLLASEGKPDEVELAKAPTCSHCRKKGCIMSRFSGRPDLPKFATGTATSGLATVWQISKGDRLAMAHEVTLDIATKFVLHKDVKIDVKNSEGKLGSLLVSKGNIEWVPAGNSVNKRRLSWARFAQLMELEGKPVRVPKKE